MYNKRTYRVYDSTDIIQFVESEIKKLSTLRDSLEDNNKQPLSKSSKKLLRRCLVDVIDDLFGEALECYVAGNDENYDDYIEQIEQLREITK